MTEQQSRPPEDDETGGLTDAQMRRLFIGGGIGIVVVGVIVVLVMSLTSTLPGDQPATPEGPRESLPPLAQECPPPTSSPEEDPPEAPEPEGERTVDADTGISYKAYGEPWKTWDQGGFVQGDLHVEYLTGQYFVTETYPQGSYMATILSGTVEAAVNDGTVLDLECIGPKVAADVRANYYPTPNEMEEIREEPAVLSGRPAWVKEFRLTFDEPGLSADSELVAVALIDVGRPEAAVLYVSIPDTHDQYDDVVGELFESVRPVES